MPVAPSVRAVRYLSIRVVLESLVLPAAVTQVALTLQLLTSPRGRNSKLSVIVDPGFIVVGIFWKVICPLGS
jgi:hypothetical protein